MRGERLRFRSPPRTDVRFRGGPGTVSRSTSDRENLPDEVTPEVDYRDVHVDYVLSNRLVTGAGAPGREEDVPHGRFDDEAEPPGETASPGDPRPTGAAPPPATGNPASRRGQRTSGGRAGGRDRTR